MPNILKTKSREEAIQALRDLQGDRSQANKAALDDQGGDEEANSPAARQSTVH